MPVSYKPDFPRTGVAATEVFIYDTSALVQVLDELHGELTATAEPDSNGLGNFGDYLLPRLVQRGRVFAHPMPGYWRDLGRPETYLAAHQDLIHGETGLFDDPDWPILARLPQRPPARIHTGARIEDSLVSPGCEVSGHLCRSVIGPGVVLERGSQITDSVILADVTMGKGAVTSWSILDRGTTVGDNARVGGRPPRQPPESEHITLVGRDSHIAPNSTIPRGSRLEPGTTTCG